MYMCRIMQYGILQLTKRNLSADFRIAIQDFLDSTQCADNCWDHPSWFMLSWFIFQPWFSYFDTFNTKRKSEAKCIKWIKSMNHFSDLDFNFSPPSPPSQLFLFRCINCGYYVIKYRWMSAMWNIWWNRPQVQCQCVEKLNWTHSVKRISYLSDCFSPFCSSGIQEAGKIQLLDYLAKMQITQFPWLIFCTILLC